TFNKWIVAFCITGLFSGSTFISILELSYLTGISAIWYGVAETVQVLIIAFVIIGPFREKFVVTVSGLIGERYGRAALGIRDRKHTSELQSRFDLVCRLLLEKKKKNNQKTSR